MSQPSPFTSCKENGGETSDLSDAEIAFITSAHNNNCDDDDSESDIISSSSTELCDSDDSDTDCESLLEQQNQMSQPECLRRKNGVSVNDFSQTKSKDLNSNILVDNQLNKSNDQNTNNEPINEDQIKRELSDLSVEQCIRKLNEKMSSLNLDK